MRDFATAFATGSQAPLTFDRAANPNGLDPAIRGGVLRLGVQRGAYPEATAGDPLRCDRCEVREPGKVPFAATVRHSFILRLSPDFPQVPHRFVAAQLKRNHDGGSPLFALRVEQGRFFADWRLPGLAVEHHDRLAGCAHVWTRFDLVSGQDGAELRVDGVRLTRIRHCFGPADLSRYLKVGPYRDRMSGWGDGPATVEVRSVTRTILDDGRGPDLPVDPSAG